MSNFLTRHAVALLCIIAVNPVWQAAHADAVSRVSAAADWAALTATLNNNPINFAYSTSSFSYGKAEYVDNTSPGVSANAPGWGDTDAKQTIPNAEGHGYTSVASINADGLGTADGMINTYGRGAAYAYRIGYFDLRGASSTNLFSLLVSLTFNLEQFFDYDVSTDSVGGYNTYNIGFGYVDAQGISRTTARPTVEFKHYGYQGTPWCANGDCNGTLSLTNTLNISETIAGGSIYFVDAYVYSDANAGTPAAVPEPAALALIGVGLVGIAMSRRRESTGKV